MILLPTRGRPENLKRFMEAALATGMTEPGVVIVDDDDAHNYEGMVLPENWAAIVTRRTWFSHKVNNAFYAFPNEPYYGLMADDQLPRTQGWSEKLAEAAKAGKIAWVDDGLVTPEKKIIGHPFLPGKLCRSLGWFSCPYVNHFYVDNVWYDLANDLDISEKIEDQLVENMHFTAGKSPFDPTYAQRPLPSADKVSYERYKEILYPTNLARAREDMAA